MNTTIPLPAAVPYWNMIKNSSREVKESLLNMLYVSLTEENSRTSKNDVKLLSGTWEDSRTTEEIIADLRASRTSNVVSDMIMVTDNTRHFQNIKGIKLENWINR